jgi:hypothetical protein
MRNNGSGTSEGINQVDFSALTKPIFMPIALNMLMLTIRIKWHFGVE